MSDKFTRIKQKYIGTFAQKQQDLIGAWDDKDISLLQSLLHKLAGSSGSYGYDEISLLCHKIMELLEKYKPENDSHIDGYLQRVFIVLNNA